MSYFYLDSTQLLKFIIVCFCFGLTTEIYYRLPEKIPGGLKRFKKHIYLYNIVICTVVTYRNSGTSKIDTIQ